MELQPGPLSQALLQVGEQFELSLFFAEEHLDGFVIPAISGDFTARESLDELLRNACLKYEFVRERLVAITPGCTRAAAPQQEVAEPRAPEPAPAIPLVEEVLVREQYVTGSRIRQPEFNQSMPIEVIDQSEIVLSGYQAVSELLR